MDLPTDAVESEIPTTSHEMTMRAINLEAPVEALLREVKEESDLSVLAQAAAQEKSMGARGSVIQAIFERAETLRSHGPGSESAKEALFEYKTPTTPRQALEHESGDGAQAKKKLTFEERIKAEQSKKQIEFMNTPDKLFKVITVKENGTLVFPWGHVMAPQQEVKDAKAEKVLVKFRPSLVYLKDCPQCTERNRPERGAQGICDHCQFDIKGHLKRDFTQNPEKYPGIALA